MYKKTMLKKTLPIFLVPLFFLSSCTNEYWQFHDQKTGFTEHKKSVEQNLATFSVEKIEPRNAEILTTPDEKVLDRLVSMIDRSEKQVFVEVYILTEKRII